MLTATKAFWKKYWALGILLTMLAAVMIAKWIPNAYAAPTNQQILADDINEFINAIGNTSLQYMKDAYDLCIKLFKPDTSKTAITGYNALTNFIRGIGFGMVIVYFLLSIIKESMRGDEFGMEAWTRLLVQLGLALTVIIFLPNIMTALFDFGKAVTDVIIGSTKPQSALDGMNGRTASAEAKQLADEFREKLLNGGIY